MSSDEPTKKNIDTPADVEYAVDETIDDSVVAEESAQETVKKLREKLKVAIAEKQEYLNSWQKDKAEFLNARKRDKEDNDRFKKFAAENFASELLPVLESFNMAFSNKEAWEKVDKNWRNGVEYIASQLKGVLESNGVKELNPVGEKFDPMLHEAVDFVKVTDETKNQTIVAVVAKGYGFYDRILKAPKVTVGEFQKV